MFYRISTCKGIGPAIDTLFHVIQDRYDSTHRMAYFNNTTSGALAQALKESSAAWVTDPQRTSKFDYQRVSSIFELVEKVSVADCDLVIVEHVDAIMQENTLKDYAEQNLALTHLMASLQDILFIDSWLYLDTYYLREKIEHI